MTVTATNKNTNKKSSNKQHKQQPRKKERQVVQVPKMGGVFPWNFGVFEASISEYKQICNNWSLTFSEISRGKATLL